ncbi:MAG: pilus assembly protein [Selenomonadaceae bacterium]|nr:pilus assembly protein [Selenomonadaceae bacterium]
MRERNERGQVIIMFAVLVPIFLAMLAFVVDVGQTYLENRNTQQVADSMIRTVNKMLSTGTSSGVLVSEIPSEGVTTYTTYKALEDDGDLNLSDSVKATLESLMSNIALLASTNGVTVEETFAIDNTTKDLYYKVEVSKAYNAIMKIASAAEGDTFSSSNNANMINHVMIMKFEKASNKVTGGLSDGDEGSADPVVVAAAVEDLTSTLGNNSSSSSTEKKEAVSNFLNSDDDATKTAVIDSLVTPSTPSEATAAVNTLTELLGNSKATTDEAKETKSEVVLAVLLSENENITDETKGELFNTYLNTEKQQGGNSQSINGYVNAAEGLTGATAQEAAQVLYLAMQENSTQSNSKIKSVSAPVDNGNGTYTINLKKNDGSRKVVVSTDSNGNIQVDYNSKAH